MGGWRDAKPRWLYVVIAVGAGPRFSAQMANVVAVVTPEYKYTCVYIMWHANSGQSVVDWPISADSTASVT